MKPSWKIMQGDVREQLALIPENTIQCVVTSPPYYGLRDYGIAGQIGLEKTPEMYVENMVEVFHGVWQVLRDDGILWLNLGDSYAGSGKAGSNPEYQKKHTQFGQKERKERMGVPVPAKSIGYKPKDLMMIPFLVAGALQRDGWYLRSIIPWLKYSAMPESVTDRPSSALEYFFLLSKSQKYFYDIEATRMQFADKRMGNPGGKGGGLYLSEAYRGISNNAQSGLQKGKWNEDRSIHGRNRRDSDWFMDSIRDILEGESGTLLHDENNVPIAVFCNPQPYSGAHFAVFSPRLITPMILAGTSPRACEKCGAPWERSVKLGKITSRGESEKGRLRSGNPVAAFKGSNMNCGEFVAKEHIITGWQPTCKCENEGIGRCVVLDPFAGSGTTLEVARTQGRDSIGIELSEEYCKLIKKRMKKFKLSLF